MAETINCLHSFLELFRGKTEDDKRDDLIVYMIKSSYFFPIEFVKERYETMSILLDSSESIKKKKLVLKAENEGFLYCRFSTAKDENSPYFGKKSNSYESIDKDHKSSKTAILKYQKENDVYYKSISSDTFYIKVKIDNDGNSTVRSLINKVCGHWVSNGEKSTIKNATISHIWGNASNPLYFTSLWNIVIIPTFCNFILDKNEIVSVNENEIEDIEFTGIIDRVNKVFKAVCWEMYNVKSMLFDGRIEIDEPSEEDLKLAKSYINLIPKEHILGS